MEKLNELLAGKHLAEQDPEVSRSIALSRGTKSLVPSPYLIFQYILPIFI